MKHHSNDYKLSAVCYYLEHNTDMRSTCEIFGCCYQSLSRWINKYREQGNVNRCIRREFRTKITPEIKLFVKQYVKSYPTTTLWEFSKLIDDKFGVQLSDMSIHNIMRSQKITRKRVRNKYYPEGRSTTEKQDLIQFYQALNQFNYKQIICLDETSIYLNMSLSYGRSKSGTCVIKKTNKYPYKRYNMLCAISADKVIGWMLYENLKGGAKTKYH